MDPFGPRSHVANTAISRHHALSPDIYDRLFDSIFFQSKGFSCWSQGNQPWQLHCHGAPGCGKTTLAAIAARRLQESTFERKAAPVACIFIEKDVSASAIVFVEDLLDCIYHQLPNPGFEPDHRYEQYEMAWQGGESTSKRIALLRKALISRIEPSDHTFLILDGYDRVSEGLQALLDREFANFQVHRLCVMITRRVPAFEVPLWIRCDGCEKNRLKLYWVCKKCYEDQCKCFAICYTCKENGLECPKDGAAYFEEPYNHINIDVSRSDNIDEYIAWDLQKEYGPLQVSSDSEGAKPQTQRGSIMSGTDSATTSSTTTEKLRKVVQSISNVAEGNIAITKLYLDNIYKYQSLNGVENVGDRLPRNIMAFFDAGIERIKQQPRAQREIALMAISAAAEKDRGVSLASLEDWMRDAITRLPHLVNAPPRSLEDVLRPANGFLIEPFSHGRQVATYNQLFTFYVRENYNNSLFWARSQLNFHRVSRTLTRLEPGQSKLTSPPMMASPPSMGDSFDTISDTTVNSADGLGGFFDRSSSSSGFPSPLKRTFSPRQLSESSDVELGIKKFGMSGRSLTMLPSAMSKREFRSGSMEVHEEPANDEHSQPPPCHSVNTHSSKVCVFCESVIFDSMKLFGDHQRVYKDLEAPETKRCVFCSTLYKKYIDLSEVDREKLQDTKSPVHRWTIRSTAKNRDSKGAIAISFQSLGQKRSQTVESTQQASLTGTLNLEGLNLQSGNSTRTFYLFPEDDLTYIPHKDELGPTTNPSINGGDQIKKWIEDCDDNHSNCHRAAKNTWVPTRLLDLQTGDPKTIRLVNGADKNIKGPYMTLSHCWGPRTKENEFLTLQGETVEEYMTKGIKLTALSTNFQQAISVARFIGMQYIWIDSLCIIQGPASDFATEGQLMHKVYRNSYCNLSAADSVDSRGGLFRARKPADILPGRYRGDGRSAIFGATPWAIVPENLWDADLLGLSIYTRGWVFQERMLAPRILHFAQNQIFWDCGTLSACEALSSGLPLPLDDSASTDRHWRGRLQESSSLAHSPLSGANDDSLEGFWSSSVLRYTKCDLTNQADKTVAIWSIAKLVRDALGDDYGAGMWSTALEEQLGWRMVDMKKSKRSVDLQWQQPSWSWTSMQGAVLIGERVAVERCFQVRGHDGKAISFQSKTLKRPAAEREHSDSLKEDLEIGWGEWQRKRRVDSSSRVVKDKVAVRSQFMPSSQPIAAKSTTAGPKRYARMALKTDPRDVEPELATKSIAIDAPIGSGFLYSNTETGTYRLRVKTNTEIRVNTSIPLNNNTLQDSLQEIILEAFPDETPSDLDLSPHSTQFLILAATKHSSPASPLGLGVDLDDYDSDNEPDMSMNTTYSGIGIMLIQSEEYLRRSTFHLQMKEAAEKINNCLVRKGSIRNVSGEESMSRESDGEMECLIRLIAFIFSRKGSSEEWAVRELKSELEHLVRLIVQLQWHKGTAEHLRHFRRTGFLRFRDLSEEMYAEVIQGQTIKFWLD